MSWELLVIAKALRAAARVLENESDADAAPPSRVARNSRTKHKPRPPVRASIPAKTEPSDVATQRAKILAKKIGLVDVEEGANVAPSVSSDAATGGRHGDRGD